MDLDSIAAAAADIQRAKSAPPAAVQINPNSLFAFSSQSNSYTTFFTQDIRTHEAYERFAETYPDQSSLPPPLEYSLPIQISAGDFVDRSVRSPMKAKTPATNVFTIMLD